MRKPDFLIIVVLFLAAFVLFPASAAATDLWVDCTGNTPGVGTSLQAAVDSLDLMGPHTIYLLGGPCVENIWIVDRQRLTITAQGIGVFIDSAAGQGGSAMYIGNSTGIRLVEIGFINGNVGLAIDRASEVTLEGCTVGGGNRLGIGVNENSSLYLASSLVTGNSRNGIGVDNSTIYIDAGNTIQNNGRNGMVFWAAHGGIWGYAGAPVVFQGNANGITLNTGSALEVYGPVTIQNNTTGMNVYNSASLVMFGDADNPISITGNSWTGINTAGGFLQLSGGIHVTNNGFGMQPLRAGVRVDDNTTLVASDAEISGNYGPGIDAMNAGVIDLAASVVSNNRGDGIRLIGNSSVLFYPPNDNIVSGNGGLAVKCDGSSVFSGDHGGVAPVACKYSPINASSSKSMKRMMAPEEDERPPKRIKR